jgi:hypothetical protein
MREKLPHGGLGGLTIADVAAAIAVENADFLARVLRRLEARGGGDATPPSETQASLEARPGDNFMIEIPWRKGGILGLL